MGRPTVMTEKTLERLRQAFLIGATKEEACAFADISKVTLYSYIDKNPDFVNDIEAWQKEPLLKAKATVIKHLDDPKNAQWYLERRAKEFKPKSDITSNNKELPTPILSTIEVIDVQTDNGSEKTAGLIE